MRPSSRLALCGLAFAFPAVAHAAEGRLPENAVPVSYIIKVTPDAEKMTFTGHEEIDLDIMVPTWQITLNAADLDISKATLDGEVAKVAYDKENETVTLTFAKGADRGEHTLRIDYSGKINTSPAGMFALDYQTDAGEKRMLTTQFEPGDARRFAPMWDEPARKATFDLEVVIPKDQVAFGNMPAKSDRIEGDKRHVVFQTTPKMSSYLLHVSIGELDRLSKVVNGVDIGVVTRKGAKEQGQFALDSAADLLAYYNDYFGTPYPLPKLDMIAAPGSSQTFGAMENWGAILYFESTLLLNPSRSTESDRQYVFAVVAHEVAHQWFGDLVTMSWWNDLWLNEGFASWMQVKSAADLHPEWNPWLQATAGQREGALRIDSRSSTHPVVQHVPSVQAASQAFDAIAYQKGQSVIRMIEDMAGPEGFRDGLRLYMKDHAYKNTVTDDLWNAVEKATGKPIGTVARDFIGQPGVPLVHLETGACKDGKTPVTLTESRFENGEKSKTPTNWQIPVKIRVGTGPIVTLPLTGAAASKVTVEGCGPVVANAGGAGYYRTAYGPNASKALAATFSTLPAIDQLNLLSDAWAVGENGDGPVTNWLDLAAKISTDANPVVLGQVAGTLYRIDWLLEGSPEQAKFRTFARARLRPAFDRIGWTAKPGENDNVAILRETLIDTLGHFDDKDVIAGAKDRFRRASADPAALPAAIYQPVLGVVATHADDATWVDILKRAEAENEPVAKERLYDALGGARDPKLARKALDFAMTGKAGPSASPSIIATVSNGHPDLAFQYALDHEDAIAGMLEGTARWRFLPRLAGSSSNAATAAALARYMEKVPAEQRAATRTSIAGIEFRVQIKAERLPAVKDWLKKRG